MKSFLHKPLDLIVLLRLTTLRGYKWVKKNKQVVMRYFSRYYNISFDETTIKTRVKQYKNHLKK